MDTSNLRPMICPVCKTVNPIQEMINTIQCIEKNCTGIMTYLSEEEEKAYNSLEG